MVGATDPVGFGFVASLAHPGGNITGLTDTVGVEFVGKQFQLLKEAVPSSPAWPSSFVGPVRLSLAPAL
jgi:putative ABC transport system substrate-binding protein